MNESLASSVPVQPALALGSQELYLPSDMAVQTQFIRASNTYSSFVMSTLDPYDLDSATQFYQLSMLQSALNPPPFIDFELHGYGSSVSPGDLQLQYPSPSSDDTVDLHEWIEI